MWGVVLFTIRLYAPRTEVQHTMQAAVATFLILTLIPVTYAVFGSMLDDLRAARRMRKDYK